MCTPSRQEPCILHFVLPALDSVFRSSLSVNVNRTPVRLWWNKEPRAGNLKTWIQVPSEPPISYVTSEESLPLKRPQCEMRGFNLTCSRVPSSAIPSIRSKALGNLFLVFLSFTFPSLSPFSSSFLTSFSQPIYISYQVPDPMPETGISILYFSEQENIEERDLKSDCRFT